MKYSEIKTILYNSEAITNIPDRWEESIPFVSVVNGKEMDTFLYWNTCKMLEIKLMIAIDKITGELCVFNKDNIREIYPSLSLIFSPIIIREPLKTTTKIKKPPPNGDFHNQAMKYPYVKL